MIDSCIDPGFPWVASFFASSVAERIALIFLDWWLARWAEEAGRCPKPLPPRLQDFVELLDRWYTPRS